LTRHIYTVLINNCADQNDLFNIPPTNGQIKQNLNQYKLDYCDSNCLISSFYDFYTNTNYTISQAAGLLSGINQAWLKQNLQAYPFSNQLKAEIIHNWIRTLICDLPY
jgi:hypothetical protein